MTNRNAQPAQLSKLPDEVVECILTLEGMWPGSVVKYSETPDGYYLVAYHGDRAVDSEWVYV